MAKAEVTSGFVKMAALIGLMGAVGIFSTARFHHAGAWLPPIPDKVGYWEGIDTPIPEAILALLGNPQGAGRRYVSPAGEEVLASIIAAGKFENYHDPTVCVPSAGFALTSKKIIPLGEGEYKKCKVRAMVFKKVGQQGDQRILMYYWQQNRNGTTDNEARMGNYRDIDARLKTGFGAVALGNQTVLVRIYAGIAPDDPNGVQAQRNVEEISRAYYKELNKGDNDE